MRLLVTRRVVALDRIDEYYALWDEARHAVAEREGRAWLFGGTTRDDHFLEFVESGTSSALLEDDTVRAALEALRQRFPPAEEEEWLEIQK
ncbi:MAG: hypothetical protein ACRELV_16860 [Longimicrobiales bacterium]